MVTLSLKVQLVGFGSYTFKCVIIPSAWFYKYQKEMDVFGKKQKQTNISILQVSTNFFGDMLSSIQNKE